MLLNEILKEKNISRYRLAKESGVALTTVNDICSGKTHIEKCSGETLYKLSTTLHISMEKLIQEALEARKRTRVSFDVFKSNICHLLKDKGDIDFLIYVLESDEIHTLYKQKWYPETFYLLAMIDYLSKENNIPICTKYNNLRCQKLDKTIYPTSMVIYDEIMKENNKERSLEKAIPEFLRYNIVENEVRNVY